MLRIENIKLHPGDGLPELHQETARILRIHAQDLLSLEIKRRSIDARGTGSDSGVAVIYTVEVSVRNEDAVLHRCRSRKVSKVPVQKAQNLYSLPILRLKSAPKIPPVIVGAGPAGLFAALVLAKAGQRPILLEQGRPVESRVADVKKFWDTGNLDLKSNVQFGEGGAGAFSDGKLNTGTRDIRHRFILEQLVKCGAPPDILIDAKPHVGTDYLHRVLKVFRQDLLNLGADIRFETCLTDLICQNQDQELSGIHVQGPDDRVYEIPCQNLILCPGHSARELFEVLSRRGVLMEAKAFAVGVRIEHRQSDCDVAQYRQYAGHPGLPASSYQLSCHLANGRGVFSFCVCPGGEVVAAASEEAQVVTNGMSEFARDRENINGALLVNITPADFGGEREILAGIAFQRRLEAAAYNLGGGNYYAPVQRVEDFLKRRPSDGPGRVQPSYRPGVVWKNLWDCLPEFIAESISEALPILGQKLRGYDQPDAVLTAVESRSSSPVRILRDDKYRANIRGLYPCGEGAGYAGGILSAAADGMRCAEAVLKNQDNK